MFAYFEKQKMGDLMSVLGYLAGQANCCGYLLIHPNIRAKSAELHQALIEQRLCSEPMLITKLNRYCRQLRALWIVCGLQALAILLLLWSQ